MSGIKKKISKVDKLLKSQKYGFEIALLAIPALLILVDQITKSMALEAPADSAASFLGFSFGISENYSWLLGFGKQLPHIFAMSLAAGLIPIVILIYLALVYYTPKLFRSLIWALSLVFAGALSNLFDKAFDGYVLDIFLWEVSSISLHLNLADFLQTAGWALFAFAAVNLRKEIWRASEKRKKLLVKKRHQVEFISYIALIAALTSLFFIVLSYQFLEYAKTLELHEIPAASTSFFNYLLIASIPGFLPLILASFYISNKIYGPIYAFERYIKSLLSDKNPPDLKLRKNDQLQELEALSLSIKRKIDDLKRPNEK